MGSFAGLIFAVVCIAMLATIDWQNCSSWVRSLRWGLFAGILSMVFMAFYTESGTPLQPAIKLDQNGRVVDVSRFLVLCVSNCTNVPRSIRVSSRVFPITDNPKVRRIGYQITVEGKDWQKFFDTIGDKESWDGESANSIAMEERVRFLLYEFNNAHSKELANFYNPLDPKQVVDLQALLAYFLNTPETLGRNGLEMIKLDSFSVDDE